MNEVSVNNDRFHMALENQSKILQDCQHSKGRTSCMECESFIGCPTREAYVKAVYESMTKGQSGGFDFN